MTPERPSTDGPMEGQSDGMHIASGRSCFALLRVTDNNCPSHAAMCLCRGSIIEPRQRHSIAFSHPLKPRQFAGMYFPQERSDTTATAERIRLVGYRLSRLRR